MVDNFKYLGVMFYRNGSWNRTQKCLSKYGTFALHNLNRLFQNITFSLEEKFKLFDCLVGSVLNYTAEVWGFRKGQDVERLHTQGLAEAYYAAKSQLIYLHYIVNWVEGHYLFLEKLDSLNTGLKYLTKIICF